jgi:hypothetical protein
MIVKKKKLKIILKKERNKKLIDFYLLQQIFNDITKISITRKT